MWYPVPSTRRKKIRKLFITLSADGAKVEELDLVRRLIQSASENENEAMLIEAWGEHVSQALSYMGEGEHIANVETIHEGGRRKVFYTPAALSPEKSAS